MAPRQLPPIFCWTKMGTESGEELSRIILRKEWERQIAGGRFFWGIGQSLGTNAATAAAGGHSLAAVFSPMLSKPKGIDMSPADVVLWNSWVDAGGQTRPLPRHVFVTSRATIPSGRPKTLHYALVCRSSVSLVAPNASGVSPLSLRNIGTGKALGASQVTAVVAYCAQKDAPDSKIYPVSFIARLEAPFCVRLAHPTLLRRQDVEHIAMIVRAGDRQTWASMVSGLRSSAAGKLQGPDRDLFQELSPLCDNSPTEAGNL